MTQPTEGMSLPQFQAGREAIRGALAAYERVTPNCHSCKHFSMGACALHGEVPKEFQEQPEACESWSFDEIPF
jgi:hypothetical protein